MIKERKEHKKGFVTAKLTFFDWGWRDKINYNAIAKSHEKEKGFMMVERLRNLFGISRVDEETFRKKMVELERDAFTPNKYPKNNGLPKWTRDQKGNIISPFSKKAREVDDGKDNFN